VQEGDLTRVTAAAMGLGAFAVAVLAGLAAGVDASSVIVRAMISLIIVYPIGMALGTVARHVVQEHVKAYRSANPITPNGAKNPGVHTPSEQGIDDENVLIV